MSRLFASCAPAPTADASSFADADVNASRDVESYWSIDDRTLTAALRARAAADLALARDTLSRLSRAWLASPPPTPSHDN